MARLVFSRDKDRGNAGGMPALLQMNRMDLIDDLTFVPLPPWWQSPWSIAAFVLVLVVLAVAAWMLRRLLSRKVVLVDPAPPRPDLHPEFLRRLAGLRARRADLSDYDLAIACSDILRDYLEWRFQSAVRFQTTREFLGSARENAALSKVQRDVLGTYLGFCDGVKFARRSASRPESDNLLDSAETFIRQGAASEGGVA